MDAVPLTLCRWSKPLDLSSLQKAQADSGLRLVSWVDKEKHLRCLRLGSSDELAIGALLLPETLLVQEYLWLPCGALSDVLPLVVLDVEQKLSLCRVTLKGSDTVEAVVVGSVSVLEVQQNVGLHRGSDAHLVSLPSSSVLQPGVVPVCTALGDALIFTYGETLSNLSLSCVLSCEGTSLSTTTPTSTKITDVVIVKELVFVLLADGSVLVSSLKSGARLGVIKCAEQTAPSAVGAESNLFRHLALLPSLRHLYCCSDTGTVCFVDLDNYFETHMQSLNHEAVGQLVGPGREERSSELDQEEEVDEEEEDMQILGYNPDKPLGLFESLQHFMKTQAAKVEERFHLRRADPSTSHAQRQRKPITYSWRDVLKVHSAEEPLLEYQPANMGIASRRLLSEANAMLAKEKMPNYFSVQKWLPSTQRGQQVCVVQAKVQGNALLIYCSSRQEGDGEGNSPSLLRKLTVLGFDGVISQDTEPKVTKLSHSVVLAACVSSPNIGACVVRENAIMLIAFGISDRELINKVLMYDDAAAAEGVCRLNHWDKCALPLNALKMALELKQMDTIAFFLKPITGKDQSDPHGDDEEWPTAAHTHLCVPLLPGQLEAALDLIINTIRKCSSQPQYAPFARQLLQLTTQFLVHVVQVEAGRQEGGAAVISHGNLEASLELQSLSATFPERKRMISETSEGSGHELASEKVPMEMLARYMKALWSFMIESKEEVDGDSREVELGEEKEMEDIYPVRWRGMNMRDIVKDALLTGCLPLAQTYMIRHRGAAVGQPHEVPTPSAKPPNPRPPTQWSQLTLEEAVESPDGSVRSHLGPVSAGFESFKVTGLGLAVECLERGDVAEAGQIVTSLGFDERESLRYICFHTVNRVLRERLLSELRLQGWLSDEEEAAVEFLHELEQAYPMTCVDVERGGGAKRKGWRSFFQPVPLPSKLEASEDSFTPSSCAEAVYPESFGGDYYMTPPQSDPPPSPPTLPLYAQLPLWSVMHWDNTTREKVLLEAFLLTHDRSDPLPASFSQQSRQAYYISHGDIDRLREETLDPVPRLLEGEEDQSEGEGPPWPRKEVMDLVEAVKTQGERHLLDAVLSDLARKGIFTDSELGDFHVLLRRLALVHGLFQRGCHPLVRSPSVDPVEAADGVNDGEQSPLMHNSAMDVFHYQFLQFCISNGFINLMYHYLEHYKLALTEDSCTVLGLMDSSLPPWVNVLVQCRMAAHRLNDPMSIFLASMACSRLLLGNHDRLLMQMIEHGRPLMALATMMYSDITITEMMSPLAEEKEWFVSKDVLQKVLAPHPKLRAAIFPPPPKKGTPAETQDISVYHLLQGNIAFSVSRLFGWQRTNRLYSQGSEDGDGTLELPHFSSPSLVAKHSHEERLPYLFFLKQGLPSFAYANFMVSKAVTKKNFNRKVTRAVRKVYSLAVVNLQDDLVTTSCAVFLEMIGQDSTTLRVDLSAARRIIDNVGEADDSDPGDDAVKKQERQQRIVASFLAVHKKEFSFNATLMEGETAEGILAELEDATVTMLESTCVSMYSLEAEEAWELPQQFCRVHHLPLSQVYLKYCAKEGSWMSFLCHAQMHGFRHDELEGLVQAYFQPRPLAEHLLLSLTASLDDPKKALAGKSVFLRQRFYHKMGVGKSRVKTAQVTSPTEHISAPEDVDPVKVPTDLFGVIFKCRETEVPWRSLLAHAVALREPLLAIIAACEKGGPATLLACMCVWLFTSMDQSTAELVTEMMGSGSVQWRGWTLADLTLLIAVYLIHSSSSTFNLFLLFEYFDPGNPVKLMMNFLHSFAEVFDLSQCGNLLKDFEKDRKKSLKMCVGNLHWADSVAMMVAKHMVVSQARPYERLHLMKLLGEHKFGASKRLKSKDVDFGRLWAIAELLDGVQIGPDQAFVTMETLSHATREDMCDVYLCEIKLDVEFVVSQLVEKQEFEVARKCADHCEDIKLTDVILQEVKQMVKTFYAVGDYSGGDQERMNLWLRCSAKLEEYNIQPLTAVQFFEEQLEALHGRAPSSSEQALLYMLVLKWLRESQVLSSEQIRCKERDIWLVQIRAMAREKDRKAAIVVTPSVLSVCSGALAMLLTAVSAGEREESGQVDLSQLVLVDDIPVKPPTQSPMLTTEERDVLEEIIGKLLNLGKLQEAQQLVNLFEYNSQELALVLCCIQLAEGRMTPSNIPHQLLRERGKGGTRHRRLSGTYLHGLSPLQAKSPSAEAVHWMEILTDHSLYAKECCNRVFTCFCVALALSWPYQSVMCQKSTVNVLLSLLSSSDPSKHDLTQEFILLNRIPSEVMGDFLCKYITEALRGHYKVALATTASMTIYPQSTMSSDQFKSTLAKLCPKPAVLGKMLLDEAVVTLETVQSSTVNSLFVAVELLVRSHDCYSLNSNTDGIAAVLREAYSCFEALSKHKKLSLMVRLLTGIGRFRDMGYIVDALITNHHFELLLQKDLENSGKLKDALLEYLRQRRPENTEVMTMLTLRFNMEREHAQIIEEEAKKKLREIRIKKPDAKRKLDRVGEEFMNAAECYDKDDCLTHKERCLFSAHLVALQISLLPQGLQIINLTQSELEVFLGKHPSFQQALVVVSGYKHSMQVDWVDPLFKRVVVAGDFKYLSDYKKVFPLTASLFEALVKRSKHEAAKFPQVSQNIVRVVESEVPNALLRRRLLSGLKAERDLPKMDGFMQDIMCL